MIMFLIYLIYLLPSLVRSREQQISFNEETPIGTLIFDLKTLSSTSITYQLLESSSYLQFNSSSNEIVVHQRIDRDHLCPSDETCHKCSFQMKFYDMFFYEILTLHFHLNDINDNAPMFSSSTYSISLTENNIPGISIRLSKADDIDCLKNSVQFYELTYIDQGHVLLSSIHLYHPINPHKSPEQDFYLVYDHQTNELNLIVNRSLDREEHDEYLFTITANDYAHTVSSKLILTVLDVNDHFARFSQLIYSVNISGETRPKTNILNVTAVDADLGDYAMISYSIVTNHFDWFEIDSQTGQIFLRTNLSQLDSKQIFKLIVAASDGSVNGIPVLATVYVYFIPPFRIRWTFGSNRIDRNRSEVFINENLPNATFLAYVTSDGPIEIPSQTGIFRQKLSDNSFTLLTDRSYDREETSFYDVQIVSGNEQRTFRIHVVDLNDCSPQWKQSIIEIDLDTEQSNGYYVLNATDDDEGLNGRVSYRRWGPSWPSWIDLIDDQLRWNCSNETYLMNVIIEVQAFDFGQPQRSSTVKIRFVRHSTEFLSDELLIGIAGFTGVSLVIFIVLIVIYYRSHIQYSSKKTEIVGPPASSASSASLYSSEKSENITIATPDMLLFTPTRPFSITGKSHENLTDQLFQSIQTNLSFLTDTQQEMIVNRGTYV